MRAYGLGLLASFVILSAGSVHASLVSDGNATALDFSPKISSKIETSIPLSNLISPSMQWSQLEMDSLKADGLNAGLPYAYSAEVTVKSDLIHSFNVAQVEMQSRPVRGNSNLLTSVLMFTAGVAMWFGLSIQRKH